ncbi:MAG: short-subunit dehydrogenase [Planctomycetota bacterium]
MVRSSKTIQTVLITGASTGLGWAIAQELLAKTAHRLILTARPSSIPRFKELGIEDGERIWVRPLDVTDEAQRDRVVTEIEAEFGAVDVLINNAGLSFRSVVEHVADDELRAQMDVNFLSPMELTRRVLPAMRNQRYGRIITISSVGGMMAMPTMSVYSASKFALEGCCEALWYEVRPWGIQVSLVQPGFIRSDGFTKVHLTRQSQFGADNETDPYHEHYASMGPFIAKTMKRTSSSPQSVARTVRRTLQKKRPCLRVPATWDARFFSFLRRIMPRFIYHRFLYSRLPNVKRWGPGGNPN